MRCLSFVEFGTTTALEKVDEEALSNIEFGGGILASKSL